MSRTLSALAVNSAGMLCGLSPPHVAAERAPGRKHSLPNHRCHLDLPAVALKK